MTGSCNDPTFLASLDGYRALPHLLRLLATGEPVDLDELVGVAGPAGADLARAVRGQAGTEWTADGRLVGFGLTSRPTATRFVVDGRPLYTWCASDTLFFTVILGRDTIAESRCPATGAPVRLAITPTGIRSVTPGDAVVSQVHRGDLVGNLRSDVCEHGHFFASSAAATGWTAAHPDGHLASVADAFAECRAACEELGWLPTRTPAG